MLWLRAPAGDGPASEGGSGHANGLLVNMLALPHCVKKG